MIDRLLVGVLDFAPRELEQADGCERWAVRGAKLRSLGAWNQDKMNSETGRRKKRREGGGREREENVDCEGVGDLADEVVYMAIPRYVTFL